MPFIKWGVKDVQAGRELKKVDSGNSMAIDNRYLFIAVNNKYDLFFKSHKINKDKGKYQIYIYFFYHSKSTHGI